MKKIMLASCLGLSLIACSEKKGEPAQEAETNVMLEEPKATAQNDEAASGKDEGLKLIEGADCLGCHKTDTKLVGPSYEEVANKYTEADVDMLADKIINGGQGNWGEVPMSPHAGLSKENAKKMVEYILSLKKK
ncbi:c-type cytochrome [Riemerella columbina]|uniref:c-type cytochrome n=1 Tax=Riemerella columbina TaxID=103810 RepID=UPI00266ED3B0|nr:c-type cytochrome [Riemerella columbina]WKS95763.1 c-type cytochrome [Riemerella columbina]